MGEWVASVELADFDQGAPETVAGVLGRSRRQLAAFVRRGLTGSVGPSWFPRAANRGSGDA